MPSNYESAKYDLKYHIVPPKGLLNDPNGLIQFKGLYHVFFQWNQHGTTHQNKSWGHATSADLIHWEYHPAALEPDEWYDRDGVYSGSAVSKNGMMYLFYTGNVRGEDGSRETYQCLATSTDGFHFEKHGPLFAHPQGYTAHVRDPKVFQQQDGQWWMILGAQRENLTGDTILYQSPNLKDWAFKGSFIPEPIPLGYMWECPDVIRFKEKDVFLFSPQGLEAEGNRFRNVYQTGYLTGKLTEKGLFKVQERHFVELDKGFEFYAPQSFVDDKGRTILFGWVGVMHPEVEAAVPTRKEGWIHALTMPREITFEDGVLIQKPVSELKKLRQTEPLIINDHSNGQMKLPSLQSEIEIDWQKSPETFCIELRDHIRIQYDRKEKLLTVSRINWLTKQREERKVVLKNDLKQMQLFLEASLLEVFINEGEEVFTLRYFVDTETNDFTLSKAGKSEKRRVTVYELKD